MIVIDPSLPSPPYEQLKQQIIATQKSGNFPTGYRLPSVRHLALELGIAPGTVARAYKDLESAGIIETRGRHGTYLRSLQETRSISENSPESLARKFAAAARTAGLGTEQALELILKMLTDETNS
ncbi:GntR family transcriptional regulator [Arcanobacterium hippocoleae]